MQQYQLTFIDLALRARRAALRRVHAQVRPREPVLLQRRAVQRRRVARVLGRCYAARHRRVRASRFDMLFGPPTRASRSRPRPPSRCAPITAATCRTPSTARKPRTTARAAASSARRSQGRVLIVDDVITAGTAVRESLEHHPRRGRAAGGRGAGARPPGARPGRAERRAGGRAAARACKCVSIVTLAELIEALAHAADGPARISDEQLTALRDLSGALRRALSLPAGQSPPEYSTYVRSRAAPARSRAAAPLRRSLRAACATPTPHTPPSRAASPIAGSTSRAWCTTATTSRRSTPARTARSSTARASRSVTSRGAEDARSRPRPRRASARRS